jgi:uncharacterized membrane protein
MDRLWQFLHLFFAFSFVGTLVVAEWNGRAARATSDWSQRALLFRIVFLATRTAGLGSLVLSGLLGHALAVSLGYRMGTDDWLRWVTLLWVLAVADLLLLVLPCASRLASLSAAAVGGGATDGWDRNLARWRAGNAVLSVLYLALLVLMVIRWRS